MVQQELIFLPNDCKFESTISDFMVQIQWKLGTTVCTVMSN